MGIKQVVAAHSEVPDTGWLFSVRDLLLSSQWT